MRRYTRDEIASLTMSDVNAAKERIARARETREGVTTMDHILCTVGFSLSRGRHSIRKITLDDAKAELLRLFAKDGRLI